MENKYSSQRTAPARKTNRREFCSGVVRLAAGGAAAALLGPRSRAEGDSAYERAIPALWRGDFETGDLSQWSGIQARQGGIQVVRFPVLQGRYAAKFLVKHGDDPLTPPSGNDRAELVGPMETEGNEAYYRWSTLFPSANFSVHPAFPVQVKEEAWQVFTQWHQGSDDVGGSPPIEFAVDRASIVFHVNKPSNGILYEQWLNQTIAPLDLDIWHDFLLHVRWSRNDGFVQLWHNGRLVVPLTPLPTMYGENNYLKQGYYRSRNITQIGSLFHDGMVKGRTLASVRY